MITKFFTNVLIRFNPFGPDAKAARSILSQIPPALAGCDVKLELLTPTSAKKPTVEITFRDKQVLQGDPTTMAGGDFTHMFDSHSRLLQFNEEKAK